MPPSIGVQVTHGNRGAEKQLGSVSPQRNISVYRSQDAYSQGYPPKQNLPSRATLASSGKPKTEESRSGIMPEAIRDYEVQGSNMTQPHAGQAACSL